MMHIAIYEKNLQALKDVNPVLCDAILAVGSNQKFDVTVSPNDPLDVNIIDNTTKLGLYKNPIQDTLLAIEQNSAKSRYPFLVYFGIGNGVFLKSVLNGYQFLKTLFVIEPEVEILFIALHLMDFSQDISSGKLKLYHTSQIEYASVREIIARQGIGAYLRLYDLHILRPFYGKYQQELIAVNKVFVDAIEHLVKSHGNCAIDSLTGDEHFINNIPLMLQSAPFHDLIAKRPSKTAIIVSTGPSLNKQLPLLKQAQNQATLIAVDASLPILEAAGIKPDIVCSLERVEETAKFFEKTSAEFQKDIVFVCAALQHKKVFENIKDGQLVVVMRPFHFMRYFGFHQYGYCGIGMSAANMAFDLAYLMDFETLILIGQDLAFANDGKSHAQGHVYGADEKSEDFNANLTVPAWGGNGTVVTTEVWTLFRNYFVTNIAESKGKLLTINSTEGGSHIDGALDIAFKDALEQYVFNAQCKEPINIKPTDKLTAAILTASAKLTLDDIINYSKEIKEEIETLFLDLTQLCEKTTELNNEGKTAEVDFKAIEIITERIEALKAKFHEPQFYDLFWEIVQSYVLSQEMQIATIVVKQANTDIEQKTRMIEYVYAHKSWLFMLAGGIDALLQVIERSKANLLTAAKEAEDYVNSLR